MTGQRSFAVSLFPSLATSAALHTVLMLVAFREAPIADHLGLVIWWFFLTIYQLVMTKFLESPRELRSIVLLSVAFVIGQLVAIVLYAPIFPTITGWIAALAMWIATYYFCINGLLNGSKPEFLMIIFETTVMTLLFSAVVIGSGAMVFGVLIHLCIGLFCILIAMMRQRTLHTRIDTEGHKNAANLLPPLILVAIAIIVALVCILISGSAAKILTQITACLSQLLVTTGKLIGAMIFWLLSLFPMPDAAPDENVFYVDPLPSGGQQEQVTTGNGIVVYLLIIAVIIGLGFCVLRIWRKIHLQGRSTKMRTVRPTVVKKNSLLENIKRFLKKISQKIHFNIQYLQHRNTGPGLLVWIERKMHRRRLKRKQGETTSAFLTRIGTRFPSCQDDLVYLSVQLDRYYFGAGDDLSPDTVRELRSKLNQAFSQTNHISEKKSHP